MKAKILFFASLFSLMSFYGIAQTSTQTVRGNILDAQSEMPLIGATVEWLNDINPKGVSTDADGNFVMPDVAIGRHQFRISYLGYNTITLPNVLVTSGKQVILNIAMEESVMAINEVVVTAEVEKDKSINEMATVSSRTFSLEEVTRFSGSGNDVSRMASNFAGVSSMNDSRNDIVVRGNSPTGVLWRLEGAPIPSPNHFSTLGATGGPVSALNTNMLKNSDFMTGAFPAEYGNAIAGVFDIGFRNGNKQRHEFTGQLTIFNGLEAMAEGPLSKKKNSSYMIAYRYSFIDLAQKAGINVGTNSVPRYSDLAFKLDFGNGKLGKFSLFGLGGWSNIDFLAKDVDEDDLFADRNDLNSYAESEIGIVGVNHRIILGDNTYMKTTISGSKTQNNYSEALVLDDQSEYNRFDIRDGSDAITVSSYVNKKFNAKHTVRVGGVAQLFMMDALVQTRENEPEWRTVRDFDGNLMLYQGYIQSQYKPNNGITLNTGVHVQYLDLSDAFAIEPRLAINRHLSNTQTLSLAYGLHHQMQPLPIYFFETMNEAGGIDQANRDLDFTKSHHFVVGYDQKFGSDWRLKVEAYAQMLEDVPVDENASTYSVLNVGDDFGIPEAPNLVNEGSGTNFGVDLTIEKFFSKGYYMLMTGSLFESKYKASDHVERNTSFNSNYTFNLLAGKEWAFGKSKQNAFTFDFKMTTAGGRYYTPIDLEASRAAGFAVRDESKAYSERYDPYYRLDIKFGYRVNSQKRKMSQTFYLDFRNITARENIFSIRYNESTEELFEVYQIGFFPDLKYQIQF